MYFCLATSAFNCINFISKRGRLCFVCWRGYFLILYENIPGPLWEWENQHKQKFYL